MAISFVGNSTPAATATNAETSLSLTPHASTAQGDYMVAAIFGRGTQNAMDVPSGWTQLATISGGGDGVSRRATVWGKFAGSSEGATSFTWTTTRGAMGLISSYRGVHPTTPTEAGTGTFTATTGTSTPTIPGVTTSAANSWICTFMGCAQISITYTPPTGMVERADANVGTPVSISLCFNDELIASAGATGSRQHTGSASNARYTGILIGLKEAASTTVNLDGTAAIASSSAGTLSVSKLLDGGANLTSAIAGSLAVSKLLAGQSDLVSSDAGALTVAKLLAGTAPIESSLGGSLGASAIALSGTVAIAASMSGALAVTKLLEGDAQISSAIAGSIAVSKLLAGNSALETAIAGSLSISKLLVGESAIVSTLSGSLGAVIVALGGTTAIVASMSAGLSVSKLLGGNAVIDSSFAGDVEITKTLSGAIAILSEIQAILTVGKLLSGTVAIAAEMGGEFSNSQDFKISIVATVRDEISIVAIAQNPITATVRSRL